MLSHVFIATTALLQTSIHRKRSLLGISQNRALCPARVRQFLVDQPLLLVLQARSFHIFQCLSPPVRHFTSAGLNFLSWILRPHTSGSITVLLAGWLGLGWAKLLVVSVRSSTWFFIPESRTFSTNITNKNSKISEIHQQNRQAYLTSLQHFSSRRVGDKQK